MHLYLHEELDCSLDPSSCGGPLDYQGNGVAPIKALVRSHVKGSALLSNVGAEVSFQLPNDASPSFKDMLLEMDNRKEELGINRWAKYL